MRMAASSSLYKLVDISANLAHPLFQKDYADVLNRAKQAGSLELELEWIYKSKNM